MAWAACLPIVAAAVLLLIFTLRGWSSRCGQRRHWVVRIGLRLTREVALSVALLLGTLLLTHVLRIEDDLANYNKLLSVQKAELDMLTPCSTLQIQLRSDG